MEAREALRHGLGDRATDGKIGGRENYWVSGENGRRGENFVKKLAKREQKLCTRSLSPALPIST